MGSVSWEREEAPLRRVDVWDGANPRRRCAEFMFTGDRGAVVMSVGIESSTASLSKDQLLALVERLKEMAEDL